MWTISKEVVVRKSRFVGRAIRAKTLEESRNLLKELKQEKSLRAATHNISAARIRVGEASVLEEANDNGEPPAGSRILQVMRSQMLSNALVVVTRWYGGQKLGSERFKIIDNVAKEAILSLVKSESKQKKR